MNHLDRSYRSSNYILECCPSRLLGPSLTILNDDTISFQPFVVDHFMRCFLCANDIFSKIHIRYQKQKHPKIRCIFVNNPGSDSFLKKNPIPLVKRRSENRSLSAQNPTILKENDEILHSIEPRAPSPSPPCVCLPNNLVTTVTKYTRPDYTVLRNPHTRCEVNSPVKLVFQWIPNIKKLNFAV